MRWNIGEDFKVFEEFLLIFMISVLFVNLLLYSVKPAFDFLHVSSSLRSSTAVLQLWFESMSFIYNSRSRSVGNKEKKSIIPSMQRELVSYVTETSFPQWSLVCGREWVVSTSQGTFMAGKFLGCVVFGMFSDRQANCFFLNSEQS